MDIWRYFRHSWATRYRSAPGRNLFYLIRDAAQPCHPVMAITALGNAVLQSTRRDHFLGWTQDGLPQTWSVSMNTVCIRYDENGDLVQVASAEPIRCIVVDERSTHDRCYELRSERGVLQIGADRVRAILNEGPIWTHDTMASSR